MATNFRPNLRTYIANGTIPPYTAVVFNTDNEHVVAAGAGAQGMGISQNDTQVTSGQKVEVALPGGGGKWTLGSGVTLSGLGPTACKSDSAGAATKAADGDWSIAMVYSSGNPGDIADVFVMPNFAGAAQS